MCVCVCVCVCVCTQGLSEVHTFIIRVHISESLLDFHKPPNEYCCVRDHYTFITDYEALKFRFSEPICLRDILRQELFQRHICVHWPTCGLRLFVGSITFSD